LDTTSDTALPFYIYIDSANLSQSTWGTLEVDKKENKASSNMKLTKMSNFECGVVMPRDIFMALLEPDLRGWQRSIAPYVRPLKPYDLSKEKPWSDPMWVKSNREQSSGGADLL